MLEMALVNWTLSEVMKRGYTPLTTPEIVRSSIVEKCGFQPRGENTQVYLFTPLRNASSLNCLKQYSFSLKTRLERFESLDC